MAQHSFLENLLNGQTVEWKSLGEVVKMQRGKTITAKNAVNGDIPVISGGQKPAYYHNEHNREGKTITIAGSGAYAGFVMYWEKPIFVSDAFSIQTDENFLNIKYVYHFLIQNQNILFGMKKGSGVPHVYPKDVATLKIPIPSLSVQSEIVRRLDLMTDLIYELKNELNLRQKQYQYYLNKFLTSDFEAVQSLATASDSGWHWYGRLWVRLVMFVCVSAFLKNKHHQMVRSHFTKSELLEKPQMLSFHENYLKNTEQSIIIPKRVMC